MTTSPPAEHDRTALELIAVCTARLRMNDPADTAAALLAAWHGFGTAEAAGALLASDNLDDTVRIWGRRLTLDGSGLYEEPIASAR